MNYYNMLNSQYKKIVDNRVKLRVSLLRLRVLTRIVPSSKSRLIEGRLAFAEHTIREEESERFVREYMYNSRLHAGTSFRDRAREKENSQTSEIKLK